MVSDVLFIAESVGQNFTDDHWDLVTHICAQAHYDLVRMTPADLQKGDQVGPKSPHSFFMLDPSSLIFIKRNSIPIPAQKIILFIVHKKNLELESIIDDFKDIRHIVSFLSVPVFTQALSAILNFYKDPLKSTDFFSTLVKENILEVVVKKLRSSQERKDLQKFIVDYFMDQTLKYKGKTSVSTAAHANNMGEVLDEFLMNAIWDASPQRRDLNRASPVALPESEQVVLQCLCDGMNFVMRVTDNFGSFLPSAFLRLVKYVLGFSNQAQHIPSDQQGAGIGLLMTLQRVLLLSYYVKKHHFTQATVVVRGDVSLREMQSGPRSLLLFYQDE